MSLLVSSLLHTAVIGISTEAIVRNAAAIGLFAAAIVIVIPNILPYLFQFTKGLCQPQKALLYLWTKSYR